MASAKWRGSGLVEEAVSASTVSAVAKVLDATVGRWHRRKLADHYRYLILDAVSVRIRLVVRFNGEWRSVPMA